MAAIKPVFKAGAPVARPRLQLRLPPLSAARNA